MSQELTKWLLEYGAGLGMLIIFLVGALIVMFKEYSRVRGMLIESQNKRIDEAKEAIRTLGEYTRKTEAQTELLRSFSEDFRQVRNFIEALRERGKR